MIAINKRTSPAGLEEKRQRAIASGKSEEEAYKKLKNPLKDQIRTMLMEDQGHLCAYCMCEIPRGDVPPDITPVIIEHYIARNPADGRSVGQGLDYQNLLAVCHGNTAKKGARSVEDLTCDQHRGNAEFKKVNPCDPSTLTSIFYGMDGTVDATDLDVKHDLQVILNLNCPTSPLVAERKNALDGLIADIGKNVPDMDEESLITYCKDRLSVFKDETDPKTPYVGVLIWYLNDMVNSLSCLLKV